MRALLSFLASVFSFQAGREVVRWTLDLSSMGDVSYSLSEDIIDRGHDIDFDHM